MYFDLSDDRAQGGLLKARHPIEFSQPVEIEIMTCHTIFEFSTDSVGHLRADRLMLSCSSWDLTTAV